MNGNSYDFQELYKEPFQKKLNFITETKIFNELQNNKKIVIFDFRPRKQYEESHCENSINIPIDEIEVDSLSSFNEKALMAFNNDEPNRACVLSKYKRLFVAIICSDEKLKKSHFLSPNREDSTQELIIGKILVFYKTLITNKIRELGIYVKGFKLFSSNYNFVTLKYPIYNK